MERTAKISLNNKSQAVRLPKNFQFKERAAYIHKLGDSVVLSPRPSSWEGYLGSDSVAPSDFMLGINDLPMQKRDL